MPGHGGATPTAPSQPELLAPALLAQIAAEDAAAARADAMERIKIQANVADAMMKALLWANGGAMVALFTFIGNVAARATTKLPINGASLWTAFALFVAGLIAALLCHFAAFVSQDRYYTVSMHEAWRQQDAAARQIKTSPASNELAMQRLGARIYLAGLGLALASTVLFAVGCGFALAGVLIR